MSLDWRLPWNASCLCGQVTMRVVAAPVISMACHCTGCQKLTSGAYSLTLMLPTAGFFVEGETQIGALHRDDSKHHYCPNCLRAGSTRRARTSTHVGFLNFRPTMLEDASWVVPFIESQTAEKLPGAVTGAKHSFERWPSPADYGRLMQEYAQEGARPR
ncbi:MAG: GFA family protein [Bacteroidetes bacterium]|nr:GFA family protein [Bacteroidota bacterium]